MTRFTEAFLDEALAPDEMAAVEEAVRDNPELNRQLSAINSRRDAGIHSVGEVWRRHRVSCPSREELGSYLLGAISEDVAQYIEFHVQNVGCRVCRANLDDLGSRQQEAADNIATRRQRYFQSSAGYLKKRP